MPQNPPMPQPAPATDAWRKASSIGPIVPGHWRAAPEPEGDYPSPIAFLARALAYGDPTGQLGLAAEPPVVPTSQSISQLLRETNPAQPASAPPQPPKAPSMIEELFKRMLQARRVPPSAY